MKPQTSGLRLSEMLEESGLEAQKIQMYLVNLIRLGLCRSADDSPLDRLRTKLMSQSKESVTVQTIVNAIDETSTFSAHLGQVDSISFTEMGLDFVRLCRGPEPTEHAATPA